MDQPIFSFTHRNPLVETMANLQLSQVGGYIGRIAALIPSGFGDEEVEELVALVGTLRAHDVAERVFSIECEDREAELRVRVGVDGDEVHDVCILSPPELAQSIGRETERYLSEGKE